MKALYIDPFSGVSGNMFVGALIDLGVPIEHLIAELDKLKLNGYEIKIINTLKKGINATFFDVILSDNDGCLHEHQNHFHKHHHNHDHNHHPEHNDEEHHHNNEAHEHHEHRGFTEISNIINASSLSEGVKEKSIAVFKRLGIAEAKVHNKSLEEIHFHEVGAIDTIIDIVGTVICLEWLKINHIYVAEIKTGSGFVKCAHGLMPVPAPATAQLLKNMYFCHGDIKKELATPTGVALLAEFGETAKDIPSSFMVDKIGYGAGSYELEIPNVLRVFLGEEKISSDNNYLYVLETNIDDMNPQLYDHVTKKLFAIGANDVWLTSIMMKKNRPGCILSVLASKTLLDEIAKIILVETTSFGIRYYAVDRIIAKRDYIKVNVYGIDVTIKYAEFEGKKVSIMPEFDDCSTLATKLDKPLKDIWLKAMEAGDKALS